MRIGGRKTPRTGISFGWNDLDSWNDETRCQDKKEGRGFELDHYEDLSPFLFGTRLLVAPLMS